jgi:hypothetical protein
MKNSVRSQVIERFFRALICIGVCTGLGYISIAAQTSRSEAALTNASIVKLIKAGFKEKTVVAIIGSRAAQFDLSTERMIELKRSGVSERIILAMLARQEGTELPDDFWSDDASFGNGTNGGRKDSGNTGDSRGGGSTDIFGSSAGARSSQKSRGGGNGSSAGDTVTTGSATVHILRPPSEADTPTKLEKIPALTNDSIVELVEAGFSEGTIIRRIEQSPVEFDFSPEKLADLRKHRVSDKILTAMKAAMGDTPHVSKPAASNGAPDK